MRRVIVPLKDFTQALTALDPHAPRHYVRDLACRIAAAPDCPSAIRIGGMFVLNTIAYAQYPALSLFYKFDDSTLYLTDITLRDELGAYADVEIWGPVAE